MSRRTPIVVIGKGGLRGVVESPPRPKKGDGETVMVRLDDGLRLAVPAGLMTRQEDGTYYLPVGPEDLERLRARGSQQADATAVIPVIVEELDVRKRTVETGRVRIT